MQKGLGSYCSRDAVLGKLFTPILPLFTNTIQYNTKFVKRHVAVASEAQAAKLVAALLRVAWVTAGLAESNGSLPLGL